MKYPSVWWQWLLIVCAAWLVAHWLIGGFLGTLIALAGVGFYAYKAKDEGTSLDQSPIIGDRSSGANPRSGVLVADYGVPHCDYRKTENGFIVKFNKTNVGFHRAVGNTPSSPGALQAIGQLIALLVVGIFWIFHKSAGGTTIEVDKDVVTIDNKRMSRDDFGGFNVDSSFKSGRAESAVATLGYQFGNRSFPFGGAWPEKQASEVASALNRHLRNTPQTGDENRATPDMLRAARPTDF